VPREVFVAGQILTAAEMNVVSDQTVMSFAGTAARGSAIPSPVEGMVSYLADSDSWEGYTTAWGPLASGFTAGTAITATNASWPVPALKFPIVKVTVIGGGGGSGASGNTGGATDGATGGTSTFDAGGAGTVTATGGAGGYCNVSTVAGKVGSAGNASGNGAMAGVNAAVVFDGQPGNGGLITVAYLNMTGISTVNVTIGAGGAAGAAGNGTAGAAGGRGEVIVEYVAG
jgi:hypothetical protein